VTTARTESMAVYHKDTLVTRTSKAHSCDGRNSARATKSPGRVIGEIAP
jgi:hypothetical protein